MRETAGFARARAAGAVPGMTATLENMIALRSIGIFDDLDPEDLAQLARAGTETWFTEGECLCREGEPGDEVFVLLDGEVSVSHSGKAAATEGPGSCIGELAVLDPAPHEATVVAATIAVRTLRLTGGSFRQALGASPVVSEGIIAASPGGCEERGRLRRSTRSEGHLTPGPTSCPASSLSLQPPAFCP